MLAELIGERNTNRPQALDAARSYIRRELARMGLSATDQQFKVHNRDAINLEVLLPGSKSKQPSLVIGAHYDTVPGTPGADDNASAVAILLEISRSLSTRKNRRTTRIVFFDCEEPPHFNYGEMGSQHHAAELQESGENVIGMICLESLGYFVKTGDTAALAPWPIRWVNRIFGHRYVVVVSNLRSIGFGWRFVWRFATSGFFPFLPAALSPTWVPDISLSDHRGYCEQGFSALMITDTAHLRNPNYHRPTDRLATLDLPRMSKLCKQVSRTVLRLVR